MATECRQKNSETLARTTCGVDQPIGALSLRSLLIVLGCGCGRVSTAGVGPDSPSRDTVHPTGLSTRFSRSFDTRRRFGGLRIVSTRFASSRAPIWCPSVGGGTQEAGRAQAYRGMLYCKQQIRRERKANGSEGHHVTHPYAYQSINLLLGATQVSVHFVPV